MSMALATPDEPDVFAVAPLGDGWTVVNPTATQRIVPPRPWTVQMATLAAAAMTERPKFGHRFAWVNC